MPSARSRSTAGIKGHYEEGRVTANGFVAQDTLRQIIDEFPGRGVSGPYSVSNPNGVSGSEKIEIVVRDRNRISGGGVTAGIDFGLTVAAELAGEEVAKSIQLVLEYDPQPPFDSGSPEKAGVERVKRIRERLSGMLETRSKANAEAAAKLA